MTTGQTARTFSGHRFEETYDLIAADTIWILVGHARLKGRDAIIDACRATAAQFVGVETTWLRFVSIGTDHADRDHQCPPPGAVRRGVRHRRFPGVD